MAYDTAVAIGSGGMGEVFKAWDAQLDRWVALKYLKHDDPELVQRLLHEARAQARVDHPGVCKVYEVGEKDGRPFIAMQYVEGWLLDEAAQDLSLEQKVLVVKKVAEAVQAAHAQGLIHRDLKPGNIIVAEESDGGLRPFVLDFGIAREQEVAGPTMTGQILGTPGYLSPEQARGEVTGLDRRTDVFSLGVILYELLAGARPFAGDSNIDVIINLLDHDPTPLRKHAPTIPRDLETVVNTCLEKERDRRYPSAQALADDLERFLAGKPVEARPISGFARLLRLARRHRLVTALAATSALLALGLLVATVGGWVKYTKDLRRERDVAEQNQQEAEEVTAFLLTVFAVADPDQSHGEEITAREILDNGAARIERELAGRPAVQGRIQGMIGEVYAGLGLYDQAMPLLEQSLQRVSSSPDSSREEQLKARVRLADLCCKRSELERAAELLAPVPSLIESEPGLGSESVVQALTSIAGMHAARGEHLLAEEEISRAIDLTTSREGEDSPLMGELLNNRSYLLARQNQWEQAIADARRALAIRKGHFGPDDPRVATTLNNLSIALRGAGQLEEAAEVGERVLELRERTLGPDHPRTSTALNNLGLTYKKLGQFNRAEELYRRSLEVRVEALGPDHPALATVYCNLAGLELERGDLDAAEAQYRQALTLSETALGPDHPGLLTGLIGLTKVATARGRNAEAEQLIQRILHIRAAVYGADSASLVPMLRALGEVQVAQGKHDDGRASLAHARQIAAAAYGQDSAEVSGLTEMLAGLDSVDSHE